VIANGNLIFDLATNITVSGNISGSGSISQVGNGTLAITGANTNFTGNWFIGTNGTILVSTGTLGLGSVSNNGQLIYSNSGTITVGGIAGTGSLTQAGSGTLFLGGSNSYTGLTLIRAGTLAIGTNGPTGTLPLGPISNNATLALNVSGLLDLTNQISGSGTVAQIGSGTTVLGQSNSFSGAYLLSAGGFNINNANALGTGTLIINGGTL
jgi:autotransporter-associated beta strand protein